MELQEVPEPSLKSDDQVKIKITRAALCRTDLYVADGSLPVEPGRILGHEAAGEVVECGDVVSGLKPGDRVVIDPVEPCGTCVNCLGQTPHLCGFTKFMGVDSQGAFADYVVISANKVYRLPDDLSFDLAIYAEPLAATRAILDKVKGVDEQILVYGTGRISKLTAHVLQAGGFGSLECSMTPLKNDYQVVIETAESGQGISKALAFLRPGGKLIVKSRHPTQLSIPLLQIIQKRLSLEAVYYSPFRQALDHLIQHRDYVATLLGNRWKLEKYREAFAEATSSESLKTFFTFD